MVALYKNGNSMKTVCTRKAAMPDASKLEKVRMWEQPTLMCPELLMYASLLLLVAIETFTAKEPDHQLKIL